MLDYHGRIPRLDNLRDRGGKRDPAGARARRAQMTAGALDGQVSSAGEHADNLACDLLMERLNAMVDCRFVPDID